MASNQPLDILSWVDPFSWPGPSDLSSTWRQPNTLRDAVLLLERARAHGQGLGQGLAPPVTTVAANTMDNRHRTTDIYHLSLRADLGTPVWRKPVCTNQTNHWQWQWYRRPRWVVHSGQCQVSGCLLQARMEALGDWHYCLGQCLAPQGVNVACHRFPGTMVYPKYCSLLCFTSVLILYIYLYISIYLYLYISLYIVLRLKV